MDGKFTLNKTDLKEGKTLRGEKQEKVEQFLADSDGFLMIVKTDFSAVFGIFVSLNFKIKNREKTDHK